MIGGRAIFVCALVLLSACTTTGGDQGGGLGQQMQNSLNNFGKGIETSVASNFTGENIVTGRMLIQSPVYGYFTCFKDINNGYVSRSPITNPGQAEGTPTMVVTRAGHVGSGQCSEWEQKGLLVSAAAQPAASSAYAAHDCGTMFDGLKPGDRAMACDAHKANKELEKVYFPGQQAPQITPKNQQLSAETAAGFAAIQAQVERDKAAVQAAKAAQEGY